jgi:exodeoxyribonuclease VII small subunit
MTDHAEPGYAAALAELEAILDEIEDDAIDVDVLASRVTRAAELLRLCRARIDAARFEVEAVVADLGPERPSDADE